MVNPDIFNQVNLSAVTSNTTGSSFDVSRLTRKTVYVSASTSSGATVNIESSPDNSTWFNIDSKDYTSGTSAQNDTYVYEANLPFLRTTLTGEGGTSAVSTWITGRGV